MKQKRIFLDYAAGTPVSPEVSAKIIEASKRSLYNPGGLYKESVEAKEILKDSRIKAAAFLGAHPDEIIFTSGGTESNNLAILGFFEFLPAEAKGGLKNFHAITSVIEHSSVLEVFRRLEEKGLKVTYLPVSEDGMIHPAELKKALRNNTAMVSIMYANNEIGTVEPIKELVKTVRHFRKNKKEGKKGELPAAYPVFHTDACQAAPYLDMNVQRLGVDLVSMSSSKIYGPKGAGILFKRRGVGLNNIFYGGSQEFGLRPGTENVPGSFGVAIALEVLSKNKEKESRRVASLRDYFLKKIMKNVPNAVVNGSLENRLPNNLNVSFPGIDNEELVIRLDGDGVACSTKSACKSDDPEVSYVIRSLGGNHYPESAVRFSLGRETRKNDIDQAVKALTEALKIMAWRKF